MSYPELDSAQLHGQAYCKIILWLEEEKIRLYEKIDRKVLREFNKSWYSHVADYARELGVPAEGFSEKNLSAKLNVLNSLANLAVHDIYRDKLETSEMNVVPPPKPLSGDVEKQRLRNLVPAVNQLLSLYSLPTLEDTAADADTVAALRCIHARICPAEQASGTYLELDKLPVGLQISDPEVKRAAAVLRLLHGLELSQLQANINHVINQLQQLTADPKTDARLGRVGK